MMGHYAKLIVNYGVILLLPLWGAGCAVKSMSIVMHMDQDHKSFFETVVLPDFEKKNDVDVTVIQYKETQKSLELINENEKDIGLLEIPFGVEGQYVESGKIINFEEFMCDSVIEGVNENYIFTSNGKIDGALYFFPRKLETRLMVYRKSKVEYVRNIWRRYRDTLDSELVAVNGHGLPSNYTFENDPEHWDYYDLFVLGWIWSRQEFSGRKAPRIAHSFYNSKGMSSRFVDYVFQFGTGQNELENNRLEALADLFHWEALFTYYEIYDPSMLDGQVKNQDIYKAFQTEEVFLSFLSQSEVFELVRRKTGGSSKLFIKPVDLAFATMPFVCSVELDHYGIPERKGGKSVKTGGWWWGVPINSPDLNLSRSLIQHITSRTYQLEEGARFGILPLRRDILGSIPVIAGENWISELYFTTKKQLNYNSINQLKGGWDDTTNKIYKGLWQGVIGQKHWSYSEGGIPDREYIRGILESITPVQD
ncbi:extracellular solute-binding protein [Chitinispirillales bacterium ANBcel5]|uniref:extracellular solute-binding protein n=1 Tax=Cellulosispirillum alkaliphilum TaxID=3039283 RepID=UPI002A53A535|nr:extracellular solute-binding protein [Chitinispirillales bacterium ANBcel5]